MPSPVNKRGLVPKLRFPEFRGAGGWLSSPLEDLISTVTPPKKIQTSDYLSEGSYPIIDQGQNVIAGWTNDSDAIVEVSQPLIVFGDHTCVLKLIRQSFAQGADGIKIIKGSGLADTAFLYQSLCFQHIVTGEYKRHYSILKTKVIAYPDRKSGEQQKIADCLASLDERITLETQKLDTLKTHKKGMMQQLFPATTPPLRGTPPADGNDSPSPKGWQAKPDGVVPKLRFPEFRDEGEWEVKSVGDFGDVVTGSTPSTVRPEFYGGGIPFVSPADISDLRFVNGTKTTLTALGFDETRPIKANSILFVCIGSTIGKVTQNVRVCATNQQINSVIPNAEHSGGFVYYILSLNAGRIANLAGKQAVPIINKTQFSAVRLPVPELREQERIADCLASLDDLITAQTQKLAALKTHKKGLMQQLFPSAESQQDLSHG